MDIDKLNVGKRSNIYTSDYPLVVIRDSDIERYLRDFFVKKRKIDVAIGEIFSQFGYTKNDLIVLKNISCYSRNSITFSYNVNFVEDSNNKITLYFDEYIYRNSMSIEDKNYLVNINCNMYSYKDIRLKVNRIEKKISSDKIYIREYNYNTVGYIIYIDDIVISVSLYKRVYIDKYEVLDDFNTLLILDKEKEIEEYLMNIELPINIDKLFREIVSLFGDIGIYKELVFKISRIDENKELNVMDLIKFVDGECTEFVMTSGNKKVSLYNTGEWKYDYSDELYEISYSGDDKQVMYAVNGSSNEVIREYTSSEMAMDMDLAKDFVEDTKRLVKNLKNNR